MSAIRWNGGAGPAIRLAAVSSLVGPKGDTGDYAEVGESTIVSGINTRVLFNNNGILGEYAVSGSGNVAMTNSPQFATPTISGLSTLDRLRAWSGVSIFRDSGSAGVALYSEDSAPAQNAQLNIGSTASYSWLQGYNSAPLSLNPLGNNVLIGTSTNSTYKLDVVGAGSGALRLNTAGLVTGVNTLQTATGTQNNLNLNHINITGDDAVAGTTGSSSNFVNGLKVQHNFGGSSATGGRNAVLGYLTMDSATNSSNPYPFYVGVFGWAEAKSPDGGSPGSERGVIYGLGSHARALNGATNLLGIIGAELSAGILTGGSSKIRSNLWLSGLGGHTEKGSGVDSSLVITNQPSSAKFDSAIAIGNVAGNEHPVDASNGTILKTIGSATVLHGIDLSSYNFSGGAFKSPGFSVDGIGAVTGASYNKVAITAPATSATLTVADGKTLTASNTLTLAGTDGQTFTFPNGSSTVATLANTQTFTGAKTFNGLTTFATGANNNFLLGQWGGDGGYGGISMNGTLAAGSLMGFFGGKTGDSSLFVVSPGNIILRPTGSSSNIATLTSSQLTLGTGVGFQMGGAAYVLSGTAIPSGGTAGSGFKFFSTSNFGVFGGSGAPTLSAAKGSLYLRSDGAGTNDRAYINTDGSTTWTALTTVA